VQNPNIDIQINFVLDMLCSMVNRKLLHILVFLCIVEFVIA